MTSSSDFSLMRSPPKMLSLVGVFDGCGGAVCDAGGGGVKLRWRVPTERGAVPLGSPPTMTAGRATTTPSAVGLPPPYACAPDVGARRPPRPLTAPRRGEIARGDGGALR